MLVLGISCFYHDAAAALIQDGQLVAAAEEERFTRKKHDYSFPSHAIRFCLNHAGIVGHDLDYVVFFEKPLVKFSRILLTTLQTSPRSGKVFREAMIGWFVEKLWVKSLIQQRVGVPEDRILFAEHHLSHAASAFYCSPFTKAAILTADGVGEWATLTLGVGDGTTIRLTQEVRFPHSLGLLYSAFTAFLGFEVNEGEYKVMGMAGFGQPRFVDEVRKLIRVQPDGSFWLDMSYFAYHYSGERSFSSKFETLFGEPRTPDTPFFTLSTGYPSYYGERPSGFTQLAERNQHYADVAASVQHVLEDVLIKIAHHLYAQTGLDNLCLAGGVALNSVANARIMRETPFQNLYVQPAAGDGGGALGAALFAYHALLGQPRAFTMEHAYWGQAYEGASITDALEGHTLSYERIESEDRLLDRVVDLLVAGKVVGWFQGRFEWGPRALGNRSILADPRRPEMKDLVNLKIKFREPFRPFAPSVPAERAEEFFEIADPAHHHPARFMLYVVPVRADRAASIPAVTHVDGSSRLQVVHRNLNPRYHELIQRFGARTGVPVLLNTSFNLRGEPIVNSPADAVETFLRSGIDALVLEDFLVEKRP